MNILDDMLVSKVFFFKKVNYSFKYRSTTFTRLAFSVKVVEYWNFLP